MTNNIKKIEETEDSDAARHEAEKRDRKRRERVEEALRRWSVGPKKRPRFAK